MRKAAKLVGPVVVAAAALAVLAGVHDRTIGLVAEGALVLSLLGVARAAFRLVDDVDEDEPEG